MSFLAVIIGICIIGFLLWLIHSIVPMDSRVGKILDVTVIIFLLLWLFRFFHLWKYVP